MEQHRLFIGAKISGHTLERIPQNAIATGCFVDGEVAFEHGARRSERLDTMHQIRCPGHRQFGGRRRRRALMPRLADRLHAQPTKFNGHVRAPRQFGDRRRPDCEILIAIPFVRPNAQHTTYVIQDNCGIRKRAGQGRQAGDLRVKQPRIKTQIQRCQLREPFTKRGFTQQPRCWFGVSVANGVTGIKGGGMANTGKPIRRTLLLRVQNIGHRRAQG